MNQEFSEACSNPVNLVRLVMVFARPAVAALSEEGAAQMVLSVALFWEHWPISIYSDGCCNAGSWCYSTGIRRIIPLRNLILTICFYLGCCSVTETGCANVSCCPTGARCCQGRRHSFDLNTSKLFDASSQVAVAAMHRK